MDDFTSELSVVDVYDIASEIGKEFEKIIDAYGTESVTNLMPKVIGALEHLESLATRNETETNTIQDLTDRIAKLELEKIEKAEDRLKFERELEQIEDHWREEAKDLVSMVTRLQDENRKLASIIDDQQQNESVKQSHTPSEVDIAVLQRLRVTIDKQREQIRKKEKELNIKTEELEAVSSQVERLTSVGKELRRKHKVTQGQVRNLIDERADFLAQLQDQHRQILTLNQKLGFAEKENEDLTKNYLDLPDLKNKAIYDLDDPNRPRFTTKELKEILQERNELKARVSDLEDELEVFKPKNKIEIVEKPESMNLFSNFVVPSPLVLLHDKSPPALPPNLESDKNWFPLHVMDSYPCHKIAPCKPPQPVAEEDENDEDAPVQGPLPYEPDDAPWKKSESGIRKFFRKLFSENNVTFLGPSPKRSLSTLSKMALSRTTSDTTV